MDQKMGSKKTPFASLQNYHDLWNKVKHDYELIQKQPNEVYFLYNFFVTAYHMVDWYAEGNKNLRKEIESNLIIKIAYHIANGAKHLVLNNPKNNAVESFQSESYYEKDYYEDGYYAHEILITLTEDYHSEFGKQMSAIDFATKLMEYWDNRFNNET